MAKIRQKALSGVRWTSVHSVAITILRFVQLAILGRILGPEAYGLIAIVMVVIESTRAFADMGLTNAIIQRKDPTKQELSTLYWLNPCAGIIIYVVLYFASPLFSIVFKNEILKPMLQLAALIFLISPFGIQFQTILHRKLRFDIIAKIDICAVTFGIAIAISTALAGYGVWALIYFQLGEILLKTILLIIVAWKMGMLPSFHFRWSDTQGYLSFGLYQIGSLAAYRFSSRVDQLIIGMLLGPTTLGYYNIAYRLIIQPVRKISPVLIQVAFPVLSIVQEDTERLKRGFLYIVRLIISVNAPVLIGLSVSASVAVPFLLGNKWIPSVPIVQIMAFYALFSTLGHSGGSLVLAKGKANWFFYWHIFLLLIIPATVYGAASINNSIIHVALSLVLLHFMFIFIFYRFLIRNLIYSISLSEYLTNLGIPFILAIVMGIIVFLSSFIINNMQLSIRFVILVGIGFISYMILCYFFQKKLFFEILEIIPDRFKLWQRNSV